VNPIQNVEEVVNKIDKAPSTVIKPTLQDENQAQGLIQSTGSIGMVGEKDINKPPPASMNKDQAKVVARANFALMALSLQRTLLATFSIGLIVAILYHFLQQ
jgi:hypothetical protein